MTATDPRGRQTLDRLINEAVNVPEILEDACVHSQVENSSCRACVDACPRGAWVLDAECLGIDTATCDGCGVCVPACPEGALHTDRSLCVGEQRNSKLVAMLACEYSQCSGAGQGMACIHALGLDDLLTLYHRGIRRLALCTAECSSCPRNTVNGFDTRLAALNELLSDRGAARFSVRHFSDSQWTSLHEQMVTAQSHSNPVSRRSWIRGLASGELKPRTRRVALGEWNFPQTPPGTLLPSASRDVRMPWAPYVVAQRCNACMACTRLCPHQAIELADNEGAASLRIHAERCTGCKICVDSCASDAISIASIALPGPEIIALQRGRCGACGVAFLVPEESPLSDNEHCPTCSHTRHHANLFQVQQ